MTQANGERCWIPNLSVAIAMAITETNMTSRCLSSLILSVSLIILSFSTDFAQAQTQMLRWYLADRSLDFTAAPHLDPLPTPPIPVPPAFISVSNGICDGSGATLFYMDHVEPPDPGRLYNIFDRLGSDLFYLDADLQSREI